jgi:hypothetical protein
METTINRKTAVLIAVDQLIDFMNSASKKHYEEKFPSLNADTFELFGGRKYLRIAQVTQPHGGRSVHCFVDAETGGVYKSAGWKAPALNGERYNLLDADSLAELHAKWDPYTGYLYKR